MVFLDSLSVTRFRGIQQTKEPLRFTRFNVLVGRNNSSKSTILQAAYLLPHPSVRNALGSMSKFQDLSQMISGPGGGVLRNLDFVYRYTGEATIDAATDLGKINLRITPDQITSTWEKRLLGTDEATISSELFGSRDTATLEKLRSLVTFVSPYSVQAMADREKWAFIENQGANTKVANEISGSLSEKFSEVLVRFNEIYLRKEGEKGPSYIRAMDMGAGVKGSLGILLFLYSVHPRLALLDDFESGMHPSMIKLMLEYLNKGDWQTILSTHSIDTLYELANLHPEGAQVMLLKKSGESDILTHRILTIDELDELLEANRDPRKLIDQLGL